MEQFAFGVWFLKFVPLFLCLFLIASLSFSPTDTSKEEVGAKETQVIVTINKFSSSKITRIQSFVTKSRFFSC